MLFLCLSYTDYPSSSSPSYYMLLWVDCIILPIWIKLVLFIAYLYSGGLDCYYWLYSYIGYAMLLQIDMLCYCRLHCYFWWLQLCIEYAPKYAELHCLLLCWVVVLFIWLLRYFMWAHFLIARDVVNHSNDCKIYCRVSW